MCCAILRLVSRGRSVDKPRTVRDSEAIQATTQPEGLGPPSPAGLQDERAEGGSTLSHQRNSILQGALARFHLMENISHRGGGRGEVRGTEQRRDREIPRRRPAAVGGGGPEEGS